MQKLLTAVVSLFVLSVAMAAADNEHEADRVKEAVNAIHARFFKDKPE